MGSALKTKTAGLLGNFDGDPANDLKARDTGSETPPTEERNIYYNFAPTWHINYTESLFWYASGKFSTDYAGNISTFTPTFSSEALAQATIDQKNACQNNTQCLYDLVTTNNLQLAQVTLDISLENVITVTIMKNNVPMITLENSTTALIDTILVRVNVPFKMTLLYNHLDPGETYTVEAFGLPYNSTFNNQTGGDYGIFEWTPLDMTEVPDLAFRIADSSGSSFIRKIIVKLCNCSGNNGDCDYQNPLPTYNITSTFQIVHCQCLEYYAGDHCELDLDGCYGDPNGPCGPFRNCTDRNVTDHMLYGLGYECGPCESGYYLYIDGTKCLDTDECANSTTNNCEQVCNNFQGGYSCSCRSGYELVDGVNCQDINECDIGLDNCSQVCVNTNGSYLCGCLSGYDINFQDYTCTIQPTFNATCAPLNCEYGCELIGGTPQCFCPRGFQIDPATNKTCIDINECTDGTNTCEQGCMNTLGGYICECVVGFSLANNQRNCTACPVLKWGRNCANTCTCIDQAKSIDQQSCLPATGCTECPKGWTGGSCDVDINECFNKTNLEMCGSNGMCNNIPGSFACTCDPGYERIVDKCSNINDCVDSSGNDSCNTNGDCTDLVLGFKCNCSEGWTGTTCLIPINECASDPCQNGGTCTDYVARFECACVAPFYGTVCQYENPFDSNNPIPMPPTQYNGTFLLSNVAYEPDLAIFGTPAYIQLKNTLIQMLQAFFNDTYTSSDFQEARAFQFIRSSAGTVRANCEVFATPGFTEAAENMTLKFRQYVADTANTPGLVIVPEQSTFDILVIPTTTMTSIIVTTTAAPIPTSTFSILAVVLGTLAGLLLAISSTCCCILWCGVWRRRRRKEKKHERRSSTDSTYSGFAFPWRVPMMHWHQGGDTFSRQPSVRQYRVQDYYYPRGGFVRTPSKHSYTEDYDRDRLRQINHAVDRSSRINWGVLKKFSDQWSWKSHSHYGGGGGSSDSASEDPRRFHRGTPPYQRRGDVLWLPPDTPRLGADMPTRWRPNFSNGNPRRSSMSEIFTWDSRSNPNSPFTGRRARSGRMARGTDQADITFY